MNEANQKPHWSFWVICIIALVWNLMGCANFIMQMNPNSLVNYPDTVKFLVANRPQWATIAFAVAVFSGIVGDVFLLLKRSVSFYLFIASFTCIILTNIHTFNISNSLEIWVGSLMSLIVAAFLIWYSAFITKKNWIN
tara:strand:- start:1308 stop:1721 length:414 start_codon:yes stop_codon:yes gene_type:complete